MEKNGNKKPIKLGLKLGNIDTTDFAKDYADLKSSSNLFKKPLSTSSNSAYSSSKDSGLLTEQELVKKFDVLKKAASVSKEDKLADNKAQKIFQSNFSKELDKEEPLDKTEVSVVENISSDIFASPESPLKSNQIKDIADLSVRKHNKPKLKKNSKEKFKKQFSLLDIDNKEREQLYKPKIRGIKSQQKLHTTSEKIVKEVEVYGSITAFELANKMSEKVSDVIKELMNLGMIVDANKMLDFDTAELVVESLGHKFKRIEAMTVDSILKAEIDNIEKLKPRPPIITVMGHVDHGKTSLLDAIRSTDIASKEFGGITQSIGAYQITLPSGHRITLIDTPGHEAFTEMRSRGAQITDIVVLVVAADDGINKQTIEAISHIKAANLPIIVAVNKIDKVDDQNKALAQIKNDMLVHNLIAEDMGGDVIFVPISALKKINVDKLEESILLLAELLDLKSNYETFASGVILDAKLDKHRGIVSSILVTKGTLKIGDALVSGECYGKVKTILTHKKESVKYIEPSTPATIIGMETVPRAGDKFVVLQSDKQARLIAEQYKSLSKEKNTNLAAELRKSTDLFSQDTIKEFPIILKADSGGSIEAITSSLAKISFNNLSLRILHSGVGSINDSDVVLANASSAPIIAFNIKSTFGLSSSKLQVDIRHYSIIYDLIGDVTNLMKGLVEPTFVKEFIGQAVVRQVFDVSNVGKVAGSYVVKGIVKKDTQGQVFRNAELVHEGKIKTLKRFKEDVKEVRESFECGIVFENYDDIQVGDKIEVFIKIEEQISA